MLNSDTRRTRFVHKFGFQTSGEFFHWTDLLRTERQLLRFLDFLLCVQLRSSSAVSANDVILILDALEASVVHQGSVVQ